MLLFIPVAMENREHGVVWPVAVTNPPLQMRWVRVALQPCQVPLRALAQIMVPLRQRRWELTAHGSLSGLMEQLKVVLQGLQQLRALHRETIRLLLSIIKIARQLPRFRLPAMPRRFQMQVQLFRFVRAVVAPLVPTQLRDIPIPGRLQQGLAAVPPQSQL